MSTLWWHMDPIRIPKTSTFYIAACMSGLHSYITVGAQNQLGENTMLVDVGKAMPYRQRKTCPLTILFKMLLGILNAEIMNEKKLVNVQLEDDDQKNKAYPVNYLAYEIRWKNYSAWLRKLKFLNPQLYAYVPVQDDGQEIEFKFMQLKDWGYTPDDGLVNTAQHKNQLSFTYDCRTTAQELTQASLPPGTSIQQTLPNQFFKHFACNNEIIGGKFSRPLIILPPPPSAYELNVDAPTQIILLKHYRQMERILCTHVHDPQTLKKFNGLKAIYQEAVNDRQISSVSLLEAIRQWGKKNKLLIDMHRGHHFFWQKTTTRNFVQEMEKKYQSLTEMEMCSLQR
jgi:hypothetical protein